MFRFFLILGCVFGVVTSWRIWSWARMYRSRNGINVARRTRDRLKRGSKYSKSRKQTLVALTADVLRETKIFPFTAAYEEEVNKIIVAMDKRIDDELMTVNHLYLQQCLCAFGSLGIAVLMIMAQYVSSGEFVPVWFALVLAAPILFKIPLWNMRSEFVKEQKFAMSQWLEFYNMYYAQFAQENYGLLIDVVDNFLPLANSALSKILKRFRMDLDTGGDEYALDRLKNRYRDNMRIHKFVSVALMRLNGDKSALDMMRSVQDDLLAEENLAYEKYIEFQEKKAAGMINIVIFVGMAMLFGVMIVAIGFSQ